MKRLYVHLAVEDLAAGIHFYSALPGVFRRNGAMHRATS